MKEIIANETDSIKIIAYSGLNQQKFTNCSSLYFNPISGAAETLRAER